MRAYLIDPYAETVSEVQTSGELHSSPRRDEPGIYELLSGPAKAVDCITTIGVDDRDNVLYLDDEGLLASGVPVFHFEGYPTHLAGKALVLGTDAEGDSTEPRGLSIETIRRKVIWTTKETTGEVGPGRDATPEEAKAMSHGIAEHGYIGGEGIVRDKAGVEPGFRTLRELSKSELDQSASFSAYLARQATSSLTGPDAVANALVTSLLAVFGIIEADGEEILKSGEEIRATSRRVLGFAAKVLEEIAVAHDETGEAPANPYQAEARTDG